MAVIDNLVYSLELSESSGNAIDAHAGLTFTEHGTGGIGSASGPPTSSGARDLESSDSDYFSRVDGAAVSVGDEDASWEVWIKPESLADYMGIVSKDDNASSREYGLYIIAGLNNPSFYVSNNGTSLDEVVWGSAVTAGVWAQITGGHSAANNEIWISVNGGTPVTSAHSGGVFDGTADVHLGDLGTVFPYDGLVARARMWKRDIRANISYLYNSGDGRSYADIVAEAGGGGGGGGLPVGMSSGFMD